MPVSPGGAAPVTSVFSRTGAVSLLLTDVTGALGYTPANQAGDTITGQVLVSHRGNASPVDDQYGFLANPSAAVLANYRPYGYKRQSDGTYRFWVTETGDVQAYGSISANPASSTQSIQLVPGAGGLMPQINRGGNQGVAFDTNSQDLLPTYGAVLSSACYIGLGSPTYPFRTIYLRNNYAGREADVVGTFRGGSGQTGNLLECRDHAGTLLFGVEPDGDLRSSRTAAATTLGTVTRRLPLYSEAGVLLGYLPLYDSIT